MPGFTDHPNVELLFSGEWGDIYMVTSTEGKCRALDFLQHPRQKKNEVQFARRFKHLADFGHIHNQKHFKPLRAVTVDGVSYNLWSLKDWGKRLILFRQGRNWIITHGFVKKSEKPVPAKEFTVAENLIQVFSENYKNMETQQWQKNKRGLKGS